LFPTITHQIPFVPINFPSKSFCSHKFSSTSHQLPFVPNPTLDKPTQSSKFCERLGQSAKRCAAVPWQADLCRVPLLLCQAVHAIGKKLLLKQIHQQSINNAVESSFQFLLDLGGAGGAV
jgi:hypothetical protein